MLYAAEVIWSEPIPGSDGKKRRLSSDVQGYSTFDEAKKCIDEYEKWCNRNGFVMKTGKIYKIEEDLS